MHEHQVEDARTTGPPDEQGCQAPSSPFRDRQPAGDQSPSDCRTPSRQMHGVLGECSHELAHLGELPPQVGEPADHTIQHWPKGRSVAEALPSTHHRRPMRGLVNQITPQVGLPPAQGGCDGGLVWACRAGCL